MSKVILIDFKGTDNVSKTAKTVENSVKRVGAQSATMGSQVAASSSKANKHLTDLGSQLRYMSLVAGTAAYGVLSSAKSFVMAAKDMQDSQVKLGVYAVSQGESMDETAAAAQKLYQTGLIPLTDASTALSNLLATGMGLEKATNLTNTFLDAIVVGKESINDTYGEALVKATQGVRIFQERQIDATGINTRLNTVFKEYGDTINTTTADLTNAQRWQAIYNYYMKEGARFTGAAKLASETLSGTMSRLTANVTVMKAALGNALAPAFGLLADILKTVTIRITEFAQKSPELANILISGTAVVISLTAALAMLGAIIPLVKSGVSGLTNIMKIFSAATLLGSLKIIAITVAIGALLFMILKLTGYWDKMVSSMKNLSKKIQETINPVKDLGEEFSETSEKIAKQIKKINESMSLATREFREGMAEWTRDHDKTISDLKSQIRDLEDTYKSATKNIKDDFSKAMQSLSLDHARKTEDLIRQINEEESKGVWADESKIRDLKRELARENEDYALSIAEKKEDRDADIADEKKSYTDKLRKLKTELNEELALERKHAELVAEARTWPILDEIEKRQRAYDEKMIQLKDELAEVQQTASGEIDALGGIGDSLDAINSKYINTNKNIKNVQKETSELVKRTESLNTAGGQLGRALHDIFTEAAEDIRRCNTEVTNYIKKLKDPTFNNWLTKAAELLSFNDLYGNITTNIKDFFKGLSGRADGGTVTANTPYIVGESGPELFVPSNTGRIIPNNNLTSTVININNPVVRDEADIRKIAELVNDVLTSRQKFKHLT